uniref:Uncharacterized protein n=1 Tax=uncultured bacterium EB3 TaxID=1348856 RepID=U3NBA2_9BACT|nr:hypothetical protein [uncultured bacterium EB3]
MREGCLWRCSCLGYVRGRKRRHPNVSEEPCLLAAAFRAHLAC